MAEYIDKQAVIMLLKERYKRSDPIISDINKLPVIKDYNNQNYAMNTEWINRKTKEPDKNGEYWCRYIFENDKDQPFYQVLHYHATATKPHFQHELHSQLPIKVTHWMPIKEPV